MFKGVSLLTVSGVATAFSSFLYIPFIVRCFGLELYGVLVFFQTSAAIIATISNTYSWQGLIQYNSLGLTRSIYTRVLYIDLTISAITGLLGAFLAGYLAYKKFDIADSLWMFMILFIGVPFSSPNAAISVMRLEEKLHLQAGIELLLVVIRLATVVIGSIINSLLIIIVAFVCYEIFRYSALSAIGQKLAHSSSVELPSVKSVYKFSFWGWVSSVVQLPSSQIDRIFVSVISGPEVLGMYNILKRVAMSVIFLSNPVQHALYPFFRRLFLSNENKLLEKYLVKSCLALFAICVVFYLCTWLFFDVWIQVFVGEKSGLTNLLDYRTVYLVMAGACLFVFTFVPIHPLFLTIGYAKKTAIYNCIGALLSIAVYLLLGGVLGIYAAILAFFASDLLIVICKLKKIVLKLNRNE